MGSYHDRGPGPHGRSSAFARCLASFLRCLAELLDPLPVRLPPKDDHDDDDDDDRPYLPPNRIDLDRVH